MNQSGLAYDNSSQWQSAISTRSGPSVLQTKPALKMSSVPRSKNDLITLHLQNTGNDETGNRDPMGNGCG